MSSRKLILVIGATGAQGMAVVGALLKPELMGSSPYAVRAMTRDPSSARARDLADEGVEVVQGNVDDFSSVLAALQGAYGVFVNTDSPTLGEVKELFVGIRIFEIAKQLGTVQHYVWNNLDNVVKKGGYDPKYYAEQYTGKCRVADWMQAQESVVSDKGMSWSILTTGPYMDMLRMGLFGPVKVRLDGTHVFASPIGTGHAPVITLQDLGFFARYVFDNRAKTSGRDLEVASDWVDWEYLIRTFTNVTGKKAQYISLSMDEWMGLFLDIDRPVAHGDRPTSWRDNFARWWNVYRDDVVTRDFAWLRRVHPGLLTLEEWMRATNYTGAIDAELLKADEDGKGTVRPNVERIAQL